jgi:OOP family OmpA-OmpF porin
MRSAFDAGLNAQQCAGGITPMADGLDGARRALKAETGQVAIILVSDFWRIDVKAAKATITKLKATHGDQLCLYTVQIGDSKQGPATTAALIEAVGCGDAVMAGDIAGAGPMASYVTRVLLAPLQYTKHTVSATALFDFDRDVLKQQGKNELHRLDETIKAQGVRVADIDVIGHTDSIGTAAYNEGLSLRRANAVRNYMVSEGIDGGIIDVSGMGETQPVASNATAAGRAQNRRVEIHVGAAQAGL